MEVFTDAHGRFRLDQLPPQDERVRIQFVKSHKYPYPPQWNEEGVEAELVEGKAQNIVVQLLRAAKLSVEMISEHHKFRHWNIGLRRPDGCGDEVDGGTGSGVTHKSFTFRNLTPGIYQIYANSGGFKPQQRTIEVKPGVYDINITLEMEATARSSLSGRVEWPDGTPAEHVIVWLYQYYRGTEKSLTQADGMFSFEDLFPGNYQIILKVPGFSMQERKIEIHEDDVQDFVFRLQRGSQIRGKLVFGDGVPYPERPLLVLGLDGLARGQGSHARIQGVWKPDGFKGPPSRFIFYHLVARFIEEDKFTFVFARVLPGTYWICLWDDGPPDYTGKAVPLIPPMKIVVEDVEDQFIEIPVEKMGKIVGHVFDSQTKQPIAGAKILIQGNFNHIHRSVYTDKKGYYRCELPPGKYQVSVYWPDGQWKRTSEMIQVTKNEAKTVDFPLIDDN